VSHVHRSALVPRPATLLYGLVNDVEAYPLRFDWCTEAAVLERSPGEVICRLGLRLGGFRTAFTTRNRLVPGASIDMNLVEGPFSALHGRWEFKPLGDSGCKVTLDLDFQTAGRIVGSALATGFTSVADRMVDDFVRAALAT